VICDELTFSGGYKKMADLQAIKEQLDGLTLLEASQLVKMLEEAWGVSATAPVAVAAAGGGGGAAAAAEPVEEQTEFDVVLTEGGAKKINVIKVVRTLTSLGLKEAKDAVEGAPYTLLTAVTKEAAEDAKSKLEAEGATVQVK
jgi:large subunit ribosomal protein L7/L12